MPCFDFFMTESTNWKYNAAFKSEAIQLNLDIHKWGLGYKTPADSENVLPS